MASLASDHLLEFHPRKERLNETVEAVFVKGEELCSGIREVITILGQELVGNVKRAIQYCKHKERKSIEWDFAWNYLTILYNR